MRNPFGGGLLVGAIVVGGLFAPSLHAGQAPTVYTVAEARNPAGSGPVLVLTGKGLSRFRTFSLLTGEGAPSGLTLTVLKQSGSSLCLSVLGDPAAGTYLLAAAEKGGAEQSYTVALSNGRVLPGTVESGALSASLRSDLDDAATLGGNAPTYFTDAGSLSSGTLDPARFSAYADLVAEGRIGTGEGQISPGDHAHIASTTGLQVLGNLSSPVTAAAVVVSDPNNQGDTWYANSRLLLHSIAVPANALSKVVSVSIDWRLKPKFDAGKEERSYAPNLSGAFAEIGADQHVLHGAQLFESVLAEQQKYLDVLGMTKPSGFQYPVHRHFLTFRPTASQMQDGFTLNLYLSVAMVDQNDTTGFDVVVDQAIVLGQ